MSANLAQRAREWLQKDCNESPDFYSRVTSRIATNAQLERLLIDFARAESELRRTASSEADSEI